ncbi:MAG: bifunctional pyr operon transcriptional regulator/uracil phosphoribosyltransferase PyrR [Bacteroidia bacterium]|nr:bifunctional pyr operon transcriptional regulator/uracil phosphoribosyltransferase PyrR [Bacteroidia bacterium]
MKEKLLLDQKRLSIIIDRLCHQLIENHNGFNDSAIVGLQPRGVLLSRRIHQRMKEITGNNNLLYGELDITFYRDDFRRRESVLIPSEQKIDFIIENKNVILIDDVLFTGRTIRAAMDALTAFGRPSSVELMVLIDRRYSRELPIEATYVGHVVDSRNNDKVVVDLKQTGTKDAVWLITNIENK